MYKKKQLKSYKGYQIWKVYETSLSADYCVYNEDGEVINVFKTLAGAKTYIETLL